MGLNKIKKYLLVFIVALFCVALFPGNIYADSNDIAYPSYSGFINDFAGVLGSSWKSKLEEIAARVEKETSCEIAVAIVNSLEGITIEEYAVELFEKWGIGKKKEDNGILLLVAAEDRELRIEVGYGLEGTITDLEAANIIDDIIVPRFKEEDYNSGIYDGVVAISNEIYKESGLDMIPYSDDTVGGEDFSYSDSSDASSIISSSSFRNTFCGFPFLVICLPIIFIFVIIIVIVNLIKRRCPKCRSFRLRIKLKTLEKPTYTSEGRRLVERYCTKCGYKDEKIIKIPRLRRTSFWGSGSSGGRSSGGGGFGGFGGGSSGGGGASGKW